MCEKVVCGNKSQFQWLCVTGNCQKCREFEIHEEEKSQNEEDEIHFVHYLYHTRCIVHGLLGREMKQSERVCIHCEDPSFVGKKGSICTKKEPVKHRCPIGTYMTEYYVPFLKERYAPHYPLMKMLSKQECGNERERAFMDHEHWLMRSSDFAEAFNVVCDNEIYESHYGNNPNIKCEGSDIVYHRVDDTNNNETSTKTDFFSFFSDGAKQHASTCFQNMHKQLEYLREHQILKPNKLPVILDSTDGCSGQYRSALSLYLLTVMACSFNVVIDRMVNAPAHGKGVVDALNAVTKRYLCECMRRICKVETGKENVSDAELRRKFENWMHDNNTQKSFAEQAKNYVKMMTGRMVAKVLVLKDRKELKTKKFTKDITL